MRVQQQAIAPEVQALMLQARNEIAERLHKVLRAGPMMDAIGAERAQRLAEQTGSRGVSLGRVSSEVRQAIVERSPENRLGMFKLWHVIDSIGFLADCEAGRWPYFTDEMRRTRVQWASDELEALESAVMQAMGTGSEAVAAAEACV